MKLEAIIDDSGPRLALEVTAPRHLPYAAAAMLTGLAADLREHIQARMPVVFDRPVDFTVRGVIYRRATPSGLEAEVLVPQSEDQRGRGAREYMRPEVQGAPARHQKKTEFLLSRMGVLPPGWVTTPGRRMPLDAHGNLSGRVYAQVINVLQLKAGVGGRTVAERSQKRAAKMGVAAEFFVVPPGANRLGRNGSWLPPGVWKHLPRGQIVQVLKFVRSAGYQPRLDFKAEAATLLRQRLPWRWAEARARIADRFAANAAARGSA